MRITIPRKFVETVGVFEWFWEQFIILTTQLWAACDEKINLSILANSENNHTKNVADY